MVIVINSSGVSSLLCANKCSQVILTTYIVSALFILTWHQHSSTSHLEEYPFELPSVSSGSQSYPMADTTSMYTVSVLGEESAYQFADLGSLIEWTMSRDAETFAERLVQALENIPDVVATVSIDNAANVVITKHGLTMLFKIKHSGKQVFIHTATGSSNSRYHLVNDIPKLVRHIQVRSEDFEVEALVRLYITKRVNVLSLSEHEYTVGKDEKWRLKVRENKVVLSQRSGFKHIFSQVSMVDNLKAANVQMHLHEQYIG